ncbi:MAG: flagellar hook-basal body complex protein [Lachnospiraceae bacterium]|nr:flagellar hook-basal body complex protein [Lachnospiraceae bacterium]
MMRALYSGVSGLRTHQTRMDVIGNNIANVNTTAFKAKQMNFSDMLYQTTQAATGANSANGTGGTNPRQIGLGVKAAAINTTITQEGANQSTGNPFDLKLTGEAFFVVSDGTSTFYTRDGSFDVDDAGNLCMASTGYIVQGWGVDENGDIVQGTLGGINVTAQDTFGAAATTQGRITGIIDSNDSQLEDKTGKVVTLGLYDKSGYQYDMKFGILPTTSVTNGTRDITNREKEYGLSDTIYKVDTSKLTFKYTVNGETRILSDSASPELMEDLKATIWKYVAGDLSSGSASAYQISGTHELGKKDSAITISLGAFIENTKYNSTTLTDSALKHAGPITVEFSGDIGYTKTKPTYPLSDNVVVSKISEEAVKYLYEDPQPVGTDNNAYASCAVKKFGTTGTTVSVTSLQQTYVDDNGKSQTDYTFKVGTTEITGGTNNTPIPSSLYNDVTRLLALGNESKITNTYTTQEAKETETIEKGSFKITLLGMTDATGASVDISSLVNSGTTSWDVFYNTSNGEFKYVGQEGNKSFSVNLSMLGDNFDNIDIDMSGTTNGNNGNKSSVTGKKLDGRKIGTRSGVSIGTDGIVTALYSNGMSRKLGQICVATFPNAMGLENSGDNLYQVTAGSGDASIVDIKASGTGVMTSGVLEMSNVDLSQQFTDMITTQRGFQANSRIITTSDTLLEELVNLKR